MNYNFDFMTQWYYSYIAQEHHDITQTTITTEILNCFCCLGVTELGVCSRCIHSDANSHNSLPHEPEQQEWLHASVNNNCHKSLAYLVS